MSDPYIAEIRIFGFDYPPAGWTHCDGQLIPISQYPALFAVLGTSYGGDGKTNFALPNLQDSVVINQGRTSDGSSFVLGQIGGTESVTLLDSQIPAHTHVVMTAADDTAESNKANNFAMSRSNLFVYGPADNLKPMAVEALGVAGSSGEHNNMMQYLTLNYCIALTGLFPPRP